MLAHCTITCSPTLYDDDLLFFPQLTSAFIYMQTDNLKIVCAASLAPDVKKDNLVTVTVTIVTVVGNTKHRMQAWEIGTARERAPENTDILNERHREKWKIQSNKAILSGCQ